MKDKLATRREAFERRKTAFEISPKAHCTVGGYVCDLAESWAEKQVVSGYVPIRSEIQTEGTMRCLHRMGFRMCVPVIKGNGKPLEFRSWRPTSKMVDSTFKVPVPSHGAYVTPSILLVPMLAFDSRGARMGYGGGFYDRTLEKLRAAGDVLAIGLVFAAQRVEELPTDTTDQFMDIIVTEKGIMDFRNRA